MNRGVPILMYHALSAAHTAKDVDKTIAAAKQAMAAL